MWIYQRILERLQLTSGRRGHSHAGDFSTRRSSSRSLASALRVASVTATGISLGLFLALAAGPTESAFRALPCLLFGGEAIPEPTFLTGTTVDISLRAEGHPTAITIVAEHPDGRCAIVAECLDANACSGPFTFVDCGPWDVYGIVNYAHEAPGGGLYVYETGPIPVLIFGCLIFADGFETGGTDNWTLAVP